MRSSRWRLFVIEIVAILGVTLLWWALHPEPGYFQRAFTARVAHDLQLSLRGTAPGTKLFLELISQFVGYESAMWIPLGIIGRAIMYLVIIYRLTGRPLIAGGVALSMVLFSGFAWGYQSIHIHALGSVLWLLVVYLLYLNEMVDNPDRLLYGLLTVVVISLSLIDYTPVVWGILCLGVLAVISPDGESYFIVSAIASVFYWYSNSPYSYLTFQDEGFSSPLRSLVDYFDGGGKATQYAFQNSPDIISVGMLFAASCGIIVVFYIFVKIYFCVKERSVSTTPAERVTWSIFVAGGAGTFAYLLIGRFSQFFIMLMGPLLAVGCIVHLANIGALPAGRLNKSDLLTIVTVFLLLTNCVGMAQWIAVSGERAPSGDEADRAVAVLDQNPDAKVLAALTTMGRLQTANIGNAQKLEYRRIDKSSYEEIVTKREPNADFVVIDYQRQRGIKTLGWGKLKPFSEYSKKIDSNPHLSPIWVSERYVIYRVI